MRAKVKTAANEAGEASRLTLKSGFSLEIGTTQYNCQTNWLKHW